MDKFKIPITFEDIHKEFMACRHKIIREREQLYNPVPISPRSFNMLMPAVGRYVLQIVPSRQLVSGALVYTVENVVDFHQDGIVAVRRDVDAMALQRAASPILGVKVGPKSGDVFNGYRLYTPEGERVAINNVMGDKTYIVINGRVYGINNLLIRNNEVVRSEPVSARIILPPKHQKEVVEHLTQFYTAQAAAMRLKGAHATWITYAKVRRSLLDEIYKVLASYGQPAQGFGRRQINNTVSIMPLDNIRVFTDVLLKLLYKYGQFEYLVAEPIK